LKAHTRGEMKCEKKKKKIFSLFRTFSAISHLCAQLNIQ
jgi:hypothetical protein